MSRKLYSIIAVIGCLLAVTPPAESGRNSSAAKKPGYGGTLVWGTQFKPAPINPVNITHSISLDLMNVIFNGLVRLNPAGEYEPDLAERWEISADGLVYTFYLRKGVRFHDGVELTAQDVRFSYEQYIYPENNSPYRSRYTVVDRIDVIDAHTIRFYLKESVPQFIEQLIRAVIPRHILEGKNLQEDPFNYAPVGSGPFRFARWDRDSDEMLLEYNPHYFEGRPYLDRIVVKVYSSPASLWSALMRHEVDLVQFISKSDFQVLSTDPAFKTYTVSAEAYSAILYNLHDPVLAEPAVRQAIAHSINVEGMLDRLSGVQGLKSVGPFHPQSRGFDPDVKPLEYDPDQAAKILEVNGWEDLNQDGILEKNGQDLEIRLLVDNGDPIHKRTALVLRQQLAAAGIKLKLQLYKDFSELDADYLSRHQSQAWLRYYPGRVLSEVNAVKPWYSGFTMPGQFWKYKNDELDRLIEQASTEIDIDKSYALYKKIHKRIYEEQPVCFLFFHENLFALSARFGGTESYFNINMATYTVKDWYLLDRN